VMIEYEESGGTEQKGVSWGETGSEYYFGV
jgi:hypothetical protein